MKQKSGALWGPKVMWLPNRQKKLLYRESHRQSCSCFTFLPPQSVQLRWIRPPLCHWSWFALPPSLSYGYEHQAPLQRERQRGGDVSDMSDSMQTYRHRTVGSVMRAASVWQCLMCGAQVRGQTHSQNIPEPQTDIWWMFTQQFEPASNIYLIIKLAIILLYWIPVKLSF